MAKSSIKASSQALALSEFESGKEFDIRKYRPHLAKGLKTPEDLNQMTAVFKKFMIETALNTELSDHLGYEKH
ncbi:hypothetical protein KWG10_17825, partial [Acinetobacter baumannii]